MTDSEASRLRSQLDASVDRRLSRLENLAYAALGTSLLNAILIGITHIPGLKP